LGRPAVLASARSISRPATSRTRRGRFAAFDAASGHERWSYQCAAGVNAPPVAYSVGDTSYVAVAVGGNALFGFTGDIVMAFGLAE
jgi:alcohol dehydrogenase (cytochrome c)